MVTAWIFLALSLVIVAISTTGLVRARSLGRFTPVYFALGWIASELTLFLLAFQLLVTLGFLVVGVFAYGAGRAALLLTLVACAELFVLQLRAGRAGGVVEAALCQGLGVDYRQGIEMARRAALREEVRFSDCVRPFHMRRSDVQRLRNIPYADGGPRHLLDIYRPAILPEEGCPVLFQVHGGAWIIGEKEHQALPLMHRLAAHGWVCVTANYHLSPKVRFPEHLLDNKRALAWIRRHIAEYGGDPGFVAVTGGSAGGHLSSLVALTENQSELQPGFEDVDTSVAACVPFYGIYDFLDRHGVRGRMAMTEFLTDKVMPGSPETHPELWELASPLTQIHVKAPPFFVVHGTHDSLVFTEDARHFVNALREVSENPVLYAEIPGAQHAFELGHSLRTEAVVNGVVRFLEYQYGSYISVRRRVARASLI